MTDGRRSDASIERDVANRAKIRTDLPGTIDGAEGDRRADPTPSGERAPVGADSLWDARGMRIRVTGPGFGPQGLTVKLDQPFARLGRTLGADLVLDHPAVSRRHAYLHRMPDGIFFVDLGSRTGLHYGDRPVSSGWIRPGEPLLLHSFRIEVETESAPPTRDPLGPLVSGAVGPAPSLLFTGPTGITVEQPLQHELTIAGRTAPSRMRCEGGSVGRAHLAFYHSNRRLWVVNLLGASVHAGGRPVVARRFDPGDRLCFGAHFVVDFVDPDQAKRGEAAAQKLRTTEIALRESEASRDRLRERNRRIENEYDQAIASRDETKRTHDQDIDRRNRQFAEVKSVHESLISELNAARERIAGFDKENELFEKIRAALSRHFDQQNIRIGKLERENGAVVDKLTEIERDRRWLHAELSESERRRAETPAGGEADARHADEVAAERAGNEHVGTLEAELEAVHREFEDRLQRELTATRGQRESLEEENRLLRDRLTEVNSLRAELDARHAENAELELRYDEVQGEIERLRSEKGLRSVTYGECLDDLYSEL